ncbi:hypothetical protein RSOLAG1IB_09423 [Rhizoctonia solani AG-1 IB]|uniref:F-box domain-containing protein n=1 Tax=Thanatephorus cucumeris (strain AG1-IB / isolate 7/3/14) TaxID=1108050 RepID=A0A0B7FR91_THACB|nr:hypothetical protein RSOLAG1IB_09423 [Rhizoctonia solani AG-1 IB]
MVEALWLSVTAVHLSSAYPKWTSKLYQGLTELRLSNPREPTEFIARPLPTPIPESALIAILKSSPKLRILQMGLIIKDATSVRNPVKPVLLEDLELLVVDTRRDQHVVFMKLVRPGPKPLTLSIADSSYLNEISSTGRSYAEEFLTSSNITRLILTGFVEYPDLINLLSLLPKVRVLALEELLSRQQITDTNSLPLSFTIDTLYVTHCFHTPFEDYNIQVWSLIEEVIRRHSVAELVLWGYNDSAESIVPEHIYTVCPSVSVLWGGPDPIKEFK